MTNKEQHEELFLELCRMEEFSFKIKHIAKIKKKQPKVYAKAIETIELRKKENEKRNNIM